MLVLLVHLPSHVVVVLLLLLACLPCHCFVGHLQLLRVLLPLVLLLLLTARVWSTHVCFTLLVRHVLLLRR